MDKKHIPTENLEKFSKDLEMFLKNIARQLQKWITLAYFAEIVKTHELSLRACGALHRESEDL